MKVERIETLHCDAGWRNYHFVKLTTDSGIVGWSEFDEGFGSPGVGLYHNRQKRKKYCYKIMLFK
jgi:L-alanine-DL-glutamate epimerase-like enolase superfamily enzyme